MKRMFFTGAAIILSLFAIGQQKNLDYFIQQGLDNSPLLKDYQNQVQINRVDSQRIRATYKPQVTGTSNNAYAPVIKGYGYDGADRTVDSHDAQVRRKLGAQGERIVTVWGVGYRWRSGDG